MRHPQPQFHDALSHLKREYRPARRYATGAFDLFGVADIFLILILFMFLWRAVERRPGIYLEIPEATAVEPVPLNSKVLTISEVGIMFLDNERVSQAALEDRFRQMAISEPDRTLVIEADHSVSHGDLTSIYNKALRAGLTRVAVATRIPASLLPDQEP